MAGKSQSRGAMVKSIAPFLSVRSGAKAIDFYKAAFGATESFRHDDPGSGSVVARLSVQGAEFWVADESPEHNNFSPNPSTAAPPAWSWWSTIPTPPSNAL
jgi:uncharacterized glyoxalase superfamily protein PhnB